MPFYSIFFSDQPKPTPKSPSYLDNIIKADSSENKERVLTLIMECFIKGHHNSIREYLNTHFIANGHKNKHHLLGDLTGLADTFEKVMEEQKLSEKWQYLSEWIRSEVKGSDNHYSM